MLGLVGDAAIYRGERAGVVTRMLQRDRVEQQRAPIAGLGDQPGRDLEHGRVSFEVLVRDREIAEQRDEPDPPPGQTRRTPAQRAGSCGIAYPSERFKATHFNELTKQAEEPLDIRSVHGHLAPLIEQTEWADFFGPIAKIALLLRSANDG